MAYVQVSYPSNCLQRVVNFNAIIPSKWIGNPKDTQPLVAPGERGFKTLYLLHGLFGGNTDWISSTRVQMWAEERNLAVIMPSGENHFYVDNEKTLAMHGDYVGRELVETTRGLFPLSREREDTFIVGLSMGGYGAIRNGLKYHETFGALAGLSGALVYDRFDKAVYDAPTIFAHRGYYESVFGDLDKIIGSDKDPRALVKSIKEKGAAFPKIYVCCGTEDELLVNNREFDKFLTENEVEHTYEEGPGEHNWAFWDEYILKVLDWLPGVEVMKAQS